MDIRRGNDSGAMVSDIGIPQARFGSKHGVNRTGSRGGPSPRRQRPANGLCAGSSWLRQRRLRPCGAVVSDRRNAGCCESAGTTTTGNDTGTMTSSSSNPPSSWDWWVATKTPFEAGRLQIGKNKCRRDRPARALAARSSERVVRILTIVHRH